MQTRGRIHGGASLIPALLALVITGLTAGAGERFVWSGGSNQSPYENWAKASITITNAIVGATSGDIITITNDLYSGEGVVTVPVGVTVRGFSGNRDDVVVSGDGANRCFYMNSGSKLFHLTVSNGYFDGSYGGGIYADGATISNCAIVSCVSTNGGGGGIYAKSSSTLVDTLISNNLATSDGGGCLLSGCTATRIRVCNNLLVSGSAGAAGGGATLTYCTVRDSWFVRNRANLTGLNAGGGGARGNGCVFVNCDFSDNEVYGNYSNAGGGAYYQGNNTIVLIDCTITNNRADGYGGGLGWNNTSGGSTAAYVTNCVIEGNRATYGGGIRCYGGRLDRCRVRGNAATIKYGAGGVALEGGARIANSLMSENESTGDLLADGGGGGLLLKTASVAELCTIAHNKAKYGGGLRLMSGSVTNCVVANNEATSGNQDINGDVATVHYSCSPDLTEGENNNIDADPGFKANGVGVGTNAVPGDYRLGGGSRCVNTGSTQSWMLNAVDLDGKSRVRYDIVDRGAFESVCVGTVVGIR